MRSAALLLAIAATACGSAEPAGPATAPVEVALTAPPAPTVEPARSATPMHRASPGPASLDTCISGVRAEPVVGEQASQDRGGDAYRAALALERRGEANAARKAYLELVRKQAGSAYVPGAYFAFGEMFRRDAQADPSKWPLAEQAYAEATKYRESRVETLALLRRAEALAAASKHQEALATYLRLSERLPSSPCEASLRVALLDGVLRSYADTGEPAKAPAFFARLAGGRGGNELVDAALLHLATTYFERGKPDDAKAVLRAAGESSAPMSEAFCGEAVRLAMQLGDASVTSAVQRKCGRPGGP